MYGSAIKERDINVLLIDDSVDLYDFYKQFFASRGLHFNSFDYIDNIGNDLVELLKNKHYDIIILDQRLKDNETGIDAVPKIRSIIPDAYIIMNSGYGNEELVIKCLHNKIDYVEGKKDDNEAFLRAIIRGIKTVQEYHTYLAMLEETKEKAEEILEKSKKMKERNE